MSDYLTRNWGLKLMSFVLAGSLWLLVYARLDDSERFAVDYPIQLPQQLQERYVILKQTPTKIMLSISGTPDAVGAAKDALSRYEELGLLDSLFHVNERTFQEIPEYGGNFEIPLPESKLDFPGNVEIKVVKATTIQLELDFMRRYELTVEVPAFEGELPPGYIGIEAVSIPPKVTVTGPSKQILDTDVIHTSKIQLTETGFNPTTVFRHLPLLKDIHGTPVQTVDNVLVELKFIPMQDEWIINDIQLADIQLLTNPESNIRARVDTVKWDEESHSMTITGPAPLIRMLKNNPELYSLRVDLTKLSDSTDFFFAEVHLICPYPEVQDEQFPTLPVTLKKVSDE